MGTVGIPRRFVLQAIVLQGLSRLVGRIQQKNRVGMETLEIRTAVIRACVVLWMATVVLTVPFVRLGTVSEALAGTLPTWGCAVTVM